MRQIAIAVSMMLLIFSCQKESQEEVAALAQASAPPAARSSGPAPASEVEVNQNGENIEVRYAGGVLTGDPRSTGKRKYRVGNGPVTYEVKPGDNGFKLRTADGALRWKVKISADKIKISDNEENRNPFELKRRDNGEVKIVAPGEREIGRVNGSAAKAVLLLDTIPEIERYILMAELTARKQ